MKSCFGYIRVSTKRQGDGASLEAQREAIERFASQHDINVTRWYEEQQTAAKTGRPVFMQLLRALREGRASGVIMHKIDRSARNFADWAKIGDLADTGVEIHFATESLDFGSRGGRLAANIQMAVAEDYIRNLKEEVRKGQTACLKKGLYPFTAPVGYQDNGKGEVKTLDPKRAPLVKEAFERYASGNYSIRSLHRTMQQRGLHNRYGRLLSKGCLEGILTNSFYTGIIHIRRTGAVYQGAHEPLISARLFETVQTLKAAKYGKKVRQHNHAYRGLFRCKQCQTSMIPERQKGHVYYRCHTALCPTNCIREEQLETAVTSALQSVSVKDAQWAEFTSQFHAWLKQREASDDCEQINLQLAQLTIRQDRLTDALVDGLIDGDTYNQRKRALLLERARLEDQARALKRRRHNSDHVWTFLELAKSLVMHHHLANSQEKREIVEIALSNREVFNKKVYLEPSKWLQSVKKSPDVLSCPPNQSTARRQREVMEKNFEQLLSIAKSEEATDAVSKLEHLLERN